MKNKSTSNKALGQSSKGLKGRNLMVVAMLARKAGPMKDKRTERGGAKMSLRREALSQQGD